MEPPDPRQPGEPRLELAFGLENLISLRAAVAAHGDRFGLSSHRLADLLLVAHELASNAIRHGGGSGRLTMWCEGDAAYCRVSDSGGGFSGANEAGLETPIVGAPSGRGLWLVRQLADEVVITSDGNGTTVTALLHVHGRDADFI